MTVTAVVTAAERLCPLETIAHVMRDHIIYAAYPRQHTLLTEFFCKCYESAFRYIYLKAVFVNIPIRDLPVVGVQAFLSFPDRKRGIHQRKPERRSALLQ